MYRSWLGGNLCPTSFLIYPTKGRLNALIYCESSDLRQDTEVSEEREFRAPYRRMYSQSQFLVLKTISIEIKCYRNRVMETPAWIDLDPRESSPTEAP